MTDRAAKSATSQMTHQDEPDRPLTAPLALWLLVQLATLALAATRVPLSAHFVQPGEALAVEEMLVAQFAISAMTFPFLLRDARCLIAMMLTAAPMLQLAGVLAGASMPRLAGTWTCLALWLASLAIWRSALAARHRPVAIAVANLLSLGGLVFLYLSTEFHNVPSPLSRALPLPAVLGYFVGREHFLLPLSSTAFLAACGVANLLIQRRLTRSSARAHT
jgi:hypothetical protein